MSRNFIQKQSHVPSGRLKPVLVITDNENSTTVRTLLRHKLIPVTRRSIISAIDLLRHFNIIAVVIDKEHQDVDILEFILNARDVSCTTPVFVPGRNRNNPAWNTIKDLGPLEIYDETLQTIVQQIGQLVQQKQ